MPDTARRNPNAADKTTPVAVGIAALAVLVLAAGVIGAQALSRGGDTRQRDAAETGAPMNRELAPLGVRDDATARAIAFLVERQGRPNWPTSQPTPVVAPGSAPVAVVTGLNTARVKAGAAAFQRFGCAACHSTDGKPGDGPSLLNVAGSRVSLASGGLVVADADYLHESVRKPAAKVHKGYTPVMPDFGPQIQDREVDALVEFLKSISREPAKRVETPQLQAAPK
jgi:mono/diheme cytochrome c family protein